MKLLDENGQLIYSDIACTIPAYRGPIPELDASPLVLDLQNREYDPDMLDDLFN